MSERRVQLIRIVRGVPFFGSTSRSIYHKLLVRRARRRRNREFTVWAVTRRNSRRAYETLYGSAELLQEYLQPARLHFYDEVAEACSELPFTSVLDAGCGTGHLLKAIAARASGQLDLAGFDHAENAIARARELLPRARWSVGSIYDPPFKESFDLVVCTEVLEHLRDPLRALVALHALCAHGGRLVVAVPDGEQDAWEGHVNFWTESELQHLLERHGIVAIQRIDEGRTLLAVVETQHSRV